MRMAFLPSNLDISFKSAEQQQQSSSSSSQEDTY